MIILGIGIIGGIVFWRFIDKRDFNFFSVLTGIVMGGVAGFIILSILYACLKLPANQKECKYSKTSQVDCLREELTSYDRLYAIAAYDKNDNLYYYYATVDENYVRALNKIPAAHTAISYATTTIDGAKINIRKYRIKNVFLRYLLVNPYQKEYTLTIPLGGLSYPYIVNE